MISFFNQDISFTLRNKTAIRKWIMSVSKKEKKEISGINYIFCSDEHLLKINQQFLKHNTYTDIITFDNSEGKNISGDIFISIDRVKENAEKFKTTFNDELYRVMIHGVLHLCGYKDKKAKDSELMRKMENKTLALLSKN